MIKHGIMDEEAFEVLSKGRGCKRACQGERMTSVNPQKRKLGDLILIHRDDH